MQVVAVQVLFEEDERYVSQSAEIDELVDRGAGNDSLHLMINSLYSTNAEED